MLDCRGLDGFVRRFPAAADHSPPQYPQIARRLRLLSRRATPGRAGSSPTPKGRTAETARDDQRMPGDRLEAKAGQTFAGKLGRLHRAAADRSFGLAEVAAGARCAQFFRVPMSALPGDRPGQPPMPARRWPRPKPLIDAARRGVLGCIPVRTPLGARLTPSRPRLKAALAGPAIDRPRLDRVARRMNRNRGAFRHCLPGKGDVVISANFEAGNNWTVPCGQQIGHLGHAEFDQIQDIFAPSDAAEPRFWDHIDNLATRAIPIGLGVTKSHLPADRIPITRTAQDTSVTRDRKECAASGYCSFFDMISGPRVPPYLAGLFPLPRVENRPLGWSISS